MYPYQNMNLSFEERVEDLVNRLTLEEKVSQMLHSSPEIKRLNIPAYNWWSEALHGVARAGVATVFPQSIGMAATFDEELIEEVATVISDEARAKHHEFIRENDHDIYKGLTFWSPNINIFRDPRWGRGHETYGEDPYLTSRLGVRFVNGLQGTDDKYLKLAACAKHFAVHSGPEADRHSFDAIASKKDMNETYLPAFKALVEEANVESVMGAYNRVNGEPACGSTTLLQKTLRDDWKFKGHVVSDCWAICDFHLHHKITKTPEESAAMAVKAGADLNCGSTFPHLIKAVEEKLITEEDIDNAVKRLFMTRFRLGMFDNQDQVSYSKISYEVNDQPAHHALSKEVAKRSMVLLKNNGVLPLSKETISKVAVIGPNANDENMLMGNYAGTPSRIVTPLRGIQDTFEGKARVFYAKGCDISETKVEHLGMENDRIAEAVSAAKLSDVAIVCLGLNSQIEGEEGDTGNSDASGDKLNLDLPGNQNALLEAVVATGTPTIVVILSGSALDLRWANEHADAIIQAWYPGPYGGEVLAKLILGQTDFTGRLPVTYVKETDDLPDFSDYSMKGRTYRFLNKEPLYTFGYGLSYNNYVYSGLKLKQDLIKEGESQEISVLVKNEGDFDSNEVVQVYLKDMEASTRVPNIKLVGFKSVRLKSGEEKQVLFNVNQKQMCLVNDDGDFVLEPGEFKIYVGGTAPNMFSLQTDHILNAGFKVL